MLYFLSVNCFLREPRLENYKNSCLATKPQCHKINILILENRIKIHLWMLSVFVVYKI